MHEWTVYLLGDGPAETRCDVFKDLDGWNKIENPVGIGFARGPTQVFFPWTSIERFVNEEHVAEVEAANA